MNVQQMIRAWTDPLYRSTLTEAALAALPGNPAGMIELSGTSLDAVTGGGKSGKSHKSKKSKKSHKSKKSGRCW